MNKNDESETIKVILLGESKVGKTSIIRRFVEQEFEDYTVTTLGATSCIKQFEIDNKIIKFEIWDTAGQERFRGLGRMFYNNAKIGILVYDITSSNSFKELKNYWYNELTQNTPKDISIL